MERRMLFVFILLNLLSATVLPAQEVLPKNWNGEKIKGVRFIPYATYQGNPFFNDSFVSGKIELTDGTIIGALQLKYSSYQDELIYYNSEISTQIVIDKMSLRGFSLADENGVEHSFRLQYISHSLPEYRFFELLSDGDISLWVYRKVLLLTSPIYGEAGKEKNLSYQEAYNYYLYNKERGYELIRISKGSLLSKCDPSNQKLARKILRRNKVNILDEKSFVKAWSLMKENGVNLIF